MNKLPYNEMNNWTYEYNQQNQPDRGTLVKMIEENSGISHKDAVYAARYACYLISFIFDIWFKGAEHDDIGIEDLFKYLYKNNYFKPGTSYQNYSSKDILTSMMKDGVIKDVTLKDYDYRRTSRREVYDRLMERAKEKDFHCARVCFGADDSSDHCVIVANDSDGRLTVLDTSWRPHDWPENNINLYITAKNMRWWTSIE